MPAISHKIHQENQESPEIFINLQGLAIGNGAIDPVNSYIYGDYMYQVGLVDEQDREIMLEMEADFKEAVEDGDYLLAREVSVQKSLSNGDFKQQRIPIPNHSIFEITLLLLRLLFDEIH